MYWSIATYPLCGRRERIGVRGAGTQAARRVGRGVHDFAEVTNLHPDNPAYAALLLRYVPHMNRTPAMRARTSRSAWPS